MHNIEYNQRGNPSEMSSSSARKGGWKSSASAFVGSCGTLLLFPLETIKTRFQGILFMHPYVVVNDGAANNPVPKYRGVFDALRTIVRTEGIPALFRGVGVYFIGANIASMTFFYMYEQFSPDVGTAGPRPSSGITRSQAR